MNRQLLKALTALHFNGRAGRFGFPHPGTGNRHYWVKPKTIQTNLFSGNVVAFTPRRSLNCYLVKSETNHVLNFRKA